MQAADSSSRTVSPASSDSTVDQVRDIVEWPGRLTNWGRWTNRSGTLNHITAQRTAAACASVRDGRVVSCARPLVPTELPADPSAPDGYAHRMTYVGEFAPGRHAASDEARFTLHTLDNTHLDALSHVGHQGFCFDGVPFGEAVTEADGAYVYSIDQTAPIVTRGVLLDVPQLRGVDHLERGDFVTPDDLERGAGQAQPGDALLIRTGRWATSAVRPGDPAGSGDPHGDWTGLHIDCFDFIAEHDLALVGTDSTGDTFPSPTSDSPSVHMIAEVYLGMPLLHSVDLDELSRTCHELRRFEFLFSVAPLPMPGATGSPVAPFCVF